jgi:uncharacterized protein YndB with AHSA1/START domain
VAWVIHLIEARIPQPDQQFLDIQSGLCGEMPDGNAPIPHVRMFACLVGLVALLFGVWGIAIPPVQDDGMGTAPEANQRRMTFAIEVSAPADEAFALISDIERHGEWSPQEFEATRIDSGPIAVGSRYRTAGRKGARKGHLRATDVEVTAIEPPRRFGFAATETETAGTYHTTFVFSASGTGSHIERIVDPPMTGAVPFIRHVVLAPVIRRYLQQNMDALKMRLDGGAPVT